ncbi:Ribonuclease H-like protein [Dioscorea alata]|uniref:Ribonuclease H-like protein n=1 Tax=Dioscorea alata TaxID=55571 RepID=A0ACB7WTF1_DIOAL|nr:Ribonuclease H-like protein [Dioscorea alata]
MRFAIFNVFVSLKLLAIAETHFGSVVFIYKSDEIIVNDLWWDQVDYIIFFTTPIYDMLQVMDTDRPSLHLVFEMWDTMIKKVKTTIYKHIHRQIEEKTNFYEVIYEIFIYYSNEWLNEVPNRLLPHRDAEILEERNKCLRRYFPSNEKRNMIFQEYARFSRALDTFESFDSLQDRWNLEPKSWWLVHGSSTPYLYFKV